MSWVERISAGGRENNMIMNRNGRWSAEGANKTVCVSGCCYYKICLCRRMQACAQTRPSLVWCFWLWQITKERPARYLFDAWIVEKGWRDVWCRVEMRWLGGILQGNVLQCNWIVGKIKVVGVLPRRTDGYGYGLYDMRWEGKPWLCLPGLGLAGWACLLSYP